MLDPEATKEALKLANTVAELLARFAKEPVGELGGIVADELKLLRFKRQVQILERAQAFLTERNLTPKGVPMKILGPILNNGSLEETTAMRDRWAALLASAADPSAPENAVIPAFPAILAELSADEATLLERAYERLKEYPEKEHRTPISQWSRVGLYPRILLPDMPQVWYRLATQNLRRLGVFDLPTTGPRASVDTSKPAIDGRVKTGHFCVATETGG